MKKILALAVTAALMTGCGGGGDDAPATKAEVKAKSSVTTKAEQSKPKQEVNKQPTKKAEKKVEELDDFTGVYLSGKLIHNEMSVTMFNQKTTTIEQFHLMHIPESKDVFDNKVTDYSRYLESRNNPKSFLKMEGNGSATLSTDRGNTSGFFFGSGGAWRKTKKDIKEAFKFNKGVLNTIEYHWYGRTNGEKVYTDESMFKDAYYSELNGSSINLDNGQINTIETGLPQLKGCYGSGSYKFNKELAIYDLNINYDGCDDKASDGDYTGYMFNIGDIIARALVMKKEPADKEQNRAFVYFTHTKTK